MVLNTVEGQILHDNHTLPDSAETPARGCFPRQPRHGQSDGEEGRGRMAEDGYGSGQMGLIRSAQNAGLGERRALTAIPQERKHWWHPRHPGLIALFVLQSHAALGGSG